jgi:hypothetical protein
LYDIFIQGGKMKSKEIGSFKIEKDVSIRRDYSEEEILALIDSDAGEMPSWDEGCYVG